MTTEQYRQYIDMMNQWLILQHEGKSIAAFFEKRNMSKIAIYGMGIYARHIIRELEDSEIDIEYGIDINKVPVYKNINVFQPSQSLPKVDVIVNTIIYDQRSVEGILKDKGIEIVSLEEVVFESY